MLLVNVFSLKNKYIFILFKHHFKILRLALSLSPIRSTTEMRWFIVSWRLDFAKENIDFIGVFKRKLTITFVCVPSNSDLPKEFLQEKSAFLHDEFRHVWVVYRIFRSVKDLFMFLCYTFIVRYPLLRFVPDFGPSWPVCRFPGFFSQFVWNYSQNLSTFYKKTEKNQTFWWLAN